MSLEDPIKPKIPCCSRCQSGSDENNNPPHSTCSNCERANRPEGERTTAPTSTSSDDEQYCSSCSSVNDAELISLDTRKLWHDTAHLLKCIYRESNEEFTESHPTTDLCTVKEYVQILAQFDSDALFNKVESIVVDYVNEIRNQVLKRSQACMKSSTDVQLFISYLLDEYNTFIQAAKNVSAIVSCLEERYLKPFQLTWVSYNKHLYEKLVYMDKKIQHSMALMIDSLQPTNAQQEDCSPAEYTQLLNRFLAFDEEMSEIDCLYKDCQTKMNGTSRTPVNANRTQFGVVMTTNQKKKKKKKICKKNKKTTATIDGNMNSTTTSAVNIPLASHVSSTIAPSQQGSNGSSIGSGIGGKESSSISSFDDYLLDNITASSSFTKEETDPLLECNHTDLHNQLFHGILNNLSSMTPAQCEIDEAPPANVPTVDRTEGKQPTSASKTVEDKATTNARKSKSSRRKESATAAASTAPKPSSTADLLLPPKPPSSTTTKLQADLRSMTIPSLGATEINQCPSLFSAKIQSVSFTAGTFASITTDESPLVPPVGQARLNLNLSRKAGLLRAGHEQLRHQRTSPNEIAALLASMKSTEQTNATLRSSFSDKSSDLCCCDLFPDSNSATGSGCAACTLVSTGARGKLHLKVKQGPSSDPADQPKSAAASRTTIRQCDNSIDDLVRFIDGEEPASEGTTPKKSKKKKDKQAKANSASIDVPQKQPEKVAPKEPTDEPAPTLSKRKQKAKLKLEQQQQENVMKPTSPVPSPPPSPVARRPSEKIEPRSTTTASFAENSPSPEEEVNWITISRKQGKHKPTPTPSMPTAPQSTKSKKLPPPPPNPKAKPANAPAPAQPKVTPEIVASSNKPQHVNSVVTAHVQPPVKSQTREKVKAPSAWTKPEPVPVVPASTLLATAPVFVPSSSSSLAPPKPNNDSAAPPLYFSPTDRPLPAFSPAPGSLQATMSRCIQRPTSEPRTTPSYPAYSPMNYTVRHVTSSWNDSGDEPSRAPTIPDDFPLYDPFKSGAALTIPSSALLAGSIREHPNHTHRTHESDIDEMNALTKEIEDFKKYYMDEPSIESPGAVSTLCFRRP